MREFRRFSALVGGIGMIVGSVLTIRHYFEANFPATIYEGSFCDISAFFNCDSSAYSAIAAVGGVPLGTFGLMAGALVLLAVVFPVRSLVRTVGFVSAVNFAAVVALLAYSVFGLGSLCLLCAVYYLFSFVALWAARPGPGSVGRFVPSTRVLAVAAVVTVAVALGMAEYHAAREAARRGGDAARIAAQFLDLPRVPPPSMLSPNWIVRSTNRFEDAPLRIVAWEDLLCSDCLYFARQLDRIRARYEGRMNVVFQHFPLDAVCNDVVPKDKHPGACDLAVMAVHAPDRFGEIYESVFAEQTAAKDAAWRSRLAERLGIEGALRDSTARAIVRASIGTGREYESTSALYEHGIRSTPTLLINGRLVIGTFPDEILTAMLDAALAEENAGEPTRFIEAWQ